MPNHSKGQNTSPLLSHLAVRIAALVLVSFALIQSACLSKRIQTEAISGAPVRIALLPFNVPADNKDLQWIALAAPILMAETGKNAEGLEIIPIWETMPVALNIAGASRTFTPDLAATAASWLSAKWAVLGEFSQTKTGVSMIVDFIPVRTNTIPFRYVKRGKLDIVGSGFRDAYNQFLRYLVAKPLTGSRRDGMSMTATKDLALALDREYGWFVEAQPGKAQDFVSSLLTSDEQLAQSLFSPTLYSSLSEAK